MGLKLFESSWAENVDITTPTTILTWAPDASRYIGGQIWLENLNAGGGDISLWLTLGDSTALGMPVVRTRAAGNSCWMTIPPFMVFYRFGYDLVIKVQSSNASDVAATCSVFLMDAAYALPDVLPSDIGGLLLSGTAAGHINPDGTGQVPSSNAAAAAAAALTAYDPPTNTEMEARTLAAAAYATATGQDEIKTAVGLVGNSEDTIENSESQVYNTDTADGSTVVNEES